MNRADFEQAVGECFADAVCPPVPFEAASAHECFEAVSEALGDDLQPATFAVLDDDEIARIADAFAAWFECPAPSAAQIRAAADAIVVRWPAI